MNTELLYIILTNIFHIEGIVGQFKRHNKLMGWKATISIFLSIVLLLFVHNRKLRNPTRVFGVVGNTPMSNIQNLQVVF